MVDNSLDPSEASPVWVANGTIEVVQDFSFFGSTISDDGEVTANVSTHISKAARTFRCLQWSIFCTHHLSTATKREVYNATVLSVLRYGAETWTIKSHNLRRLSGFHNRCICTIMGMTRQQQWEKRVTSKQLSAACAMEETMEELLLKHRLQWLGHVARMNDQ